MKLIELGDIENGRIILGLILPELYFWKKEQCDFGEDFRRVGFSLETKIKYDKNHFFEIFTFAIFGVGWYVSYQNGY